MLENFNDCHLFNFCYWVMLGSWKIPTACKSLETGTSMWNKGSNSLYHTSSDASLFSSSLPVLPHEKCKLFFTKSTPLFSFLYMKSDLSADMQ